jgi:hypothetical protein
MTKDEEFFHSFILEAAAQPYHYHYSCTRLGHVSNRKRKTL